MQSIVVQPICCAPSMPVYDILYEVHGADGEEERGLVVFTMAV